MRMLLIVALVALSACAPSYNPPPDDIWRPPAAVEPSAPAMKKSIVLVTTPGCAPCMTQKRLIKEMFANGELRGVEFTEKGFSTPDYPASSFPTLYICNGSKCEFREGYQSRERLLELLR